MKEVQGESPNLMQRLVRLLNIKGDYPTAVGALSPGIEVASLRDDENRWLGRERIYERAITLTGDATHIPVAQWALINPDNRTLAVLDWIEVCAQPTGMAVLLSMDSGIGYQSSQGFGRLVDDRAIGSYQSLVQILGSTAAILPGGAPAAPLWMRKYLCIINTPVRLVGPWIAYYGVPVTVWGENVASRLDISFRWRERPVGRQEVER